MLDSKWWSHAALRHRHYVLKAWINHLIGPEWIRGLQSSFEVHAAINSGWFSAKPSIWFDCARLAYAYLRRAWNLLEHPQEIQQQANVQALTEQKKSAWFQSLKAFNRGLYQRCYHLRNEENSWTRWLRDGVPSSYFWCLNQKHYFARAWEEAIE